MNHTPVVSTACCQNSGGIGARLVAPCVAASATPWNTVVHPSPIVATIAARAQYIRRLSDPRFASASWKPQKMRYARLRSTAPAKVAGFARMPSKTTPSLTRAERRDRSASPPARVMSVKRKNPRRPRPASARKAPRTPNATRARMGKLSCSLAAGRVTAAMRGMARRVPMAVERPSCHQTRGAMELRFQRTKPKGTE